MVQTRRKTTEGHTEASLWTQRTAYVVVLVCRVVLSYFEVVFRLLFPPARKSVEREIILVTGAGHGIGRETALAFGRLGAKIVLWDINKESNQATAEQIFNTGGEATAYQCDVSNPDDVRRVAELVRKDVGDVTMLVNNAGILHGGALLDLEDRQIDRTFRVNTLAHFWTVREFLPAMVEKNRGHVVTVASMSAKVGVAYLCDYASSKWAVYGFTESLRDELRRLDRPGVKTSTVCPHFVDTGMTKFPKFNKFERFLTPQETAAALVDGVLREEEIIYVPKIMFLSVLLDKLLPRKARDLLLSFSDVGIDPQYIPAVDRKSD